MRVLALCAGYGGLELGLSLATDGAARGVCYVEREAFAASVLVAQMEAGRLALAPVWSDLATFDGKPWRGVVDCIAAGFPCQPISVAGLHRGSGDERWLWPAIARVVRDARPGVVFLENVPTLAVSGLLGDVLGSLAACGFDAEWGVFTAAGVGAPHRRARIFILAYSDSKRLEAWTARGQKQGGGAEPGGLVVEAVWPSVAELGGFGFDGTASRVDELRCLGNGVVPLVAADAFRTLAARALAHRP